MTAHAHRGCLTGDGKMNFAPRPKGALNDQMAELIDAALVREAELQEPRGYLGGSRLGVECSRALAYEYAQARADRAAWREAQRARAVEIAFGQGLTPHRTSHPFPGRALRRFALGHAHEEITAKWLRDAGFDLVVKKPGGGQIGFGVARDAETGEDRIAGHIDGRINGGPLNLPYPLLWEHKIMNAKNWRACQDKGVKESKPIYWAQCQTYMGYLDLENALFTAVNTDTSELYFELVPLDLSAAQEFSDRGVRIITAERPEDLPRIAKERTDWRCKFCDFKERCWTAPEAPAVPRPNWL